MPELNYLHRGITTELFLIMRKSNNKIKPVLTSEWDHHTGSYFAGIARSGSVVSDNTEEVDFVDGLEHLFNVSCPEWFWPFISITATKKGSMRQLVGVLHESWPNVKFTDIYRVLKKFERICRDAGLDGFGYNFNRLAKKCVTVGGV